MATYYPEKEMVKIMHDLHIAPEDGKVDGSEAARILTWRAKEEHRVEYEYDPTAIRQHMKTERLKPEDVDTTNPRRNMYKYEAIFRLPISPRRGAARRKVS